VFIVVKEFLVLNGMEAERANGPEEMGQCVEFMPTRESHSAEPLLKVTIVSVVASVKRVAWSEKHEIRSERT